MFRLLTNIVESVAGAGEFVRYEPACVVPDDPGEVVRHARPIDDHARRQLREQHISRLVGNGSPRLGSARYPALGANTRVALLHLRDRDSRQFQ